jgi:hypothetical protein
VPIGPSVLMQRRAAECAASFLLSAQSETSGRVVEMLSQCESGAPGSPV